MFFLEFFLSFLFILLGGEEDVVSGEIYFRNGSPHVRLPNNGLLLGSVDLSRGGRPFNSFVGVPFGKVTARFQVALKAPAWDGIFEALKPGPKCPQPRKSSGKFVAGEEAEDCLNLNVYVPMNNTHNQREEVGYPVMVWIHGGGFVFGSGFEYGPKYFMDEDVILITFNYRLGAFGFLSTGDEVIQGNNGLKDQVLALEWIQDNIKAFGGEPSKVTIFGESAGGASVDYLLLSPTTEGLFQGAISQSGSALAPWAFNPKPRETAVELATYLKCPTASNKPSEISSHEILNCLRELSTEEISEAQLHFKPRWPPICIPLEFLPVKEPPTSPSPFLTESPWAIFANRSFPHKAIPWMTGATEDEGTALYAGYSLMNGERASELNSKWSDVILHPTRLVKFTQPEDSQIVAAKIRHFYFGSGDISLENGANLIDMYSDISAIHSTRKGAVETALKGRGSPVYLYLYAHQGPTPAMKLFGYPIPEIYAKKVGHGDDFLMQFNLEQSIRGSENFLEADSLHEEFSKNVVKLWASFAIHGEPKHSWGNVREEWKPIPTKELEGNASLLRWYKINSDLAGYIDEGGFKARAEFWENLYNDHFLRSLYQNEPVELGTIKAEL